MVADPSGTTVGKTTLPTVVSATADPITYGTPGAVHVTVDPAQATGPVTVLDGTRQLGTATLNGGDAPTVTLGAPHSKPGSHGLTVSYARRRQQPRRARRPSNVKVAKATPALKVSVSPQDGPRRPHPAERDREALGPGPHGARQGGRAHRRPHSTSPPLTDGVAHREAPAATAAPGRSRSRCTYLGNSHDKAVATTVQVRVRRLIHPFHPASLSSP